MLIKIIFLTYFKIINENKKKEIDELLLFEILIFKNLQLRIMKWINIYYICIK